MISHKLGLVASGLRRSAVSRSACVVAYGVYGGTPALLKVRDRIYLPEVEIIHRVVDGVEICYLHDKATGWCEGVNSHHIGIVNSALLVNRDEGEAQRQIDTSEPSEDGQRMIHALKASTVAEAVDRISTYKKGLKGHTIVASPDEAWIIEMTQQGHRKKKVTDLTVRSNHGQLFPGVGYQPGTADYESSKARAETAAHVLAPLDRVQDICRALLDARSKDRSDPNSPIRKTVGMTTHSLMMVDVGKPAIHLYLLDQIRWGGYEPLSGAKVQVHVHRVSDDGGMTKVV